MKFNNLNIIRGKSSLLEKSLGSTSGHISTGPLNGTGAKHLWRISCHFLSNNLNGLIHETMLLDKLFRSDDSAAGAIGGGTALQLGQRSKHLGSIKNLIQCVDISELRVWVESTKKNNVRYTLQQIVHCACYCSPYLCLWFFSAILAR